MSVKDSKGESVSGRNDATRPSSSRNVSVFVLMDEGCQECGVSSVLVGVYLTRTDAEAAMTKREAEAYESPGWRDDGQARLTIYEAAPEEWGWSPVG